LEDYRFVVVKKEKSAAIVASAYAGVISGSGAAVVA